MGMLQHSIDELNNADAFYRWMIARETRIAIAIESTVAEPYRKRTSFSKEYGQKARNWRRNDGHL